MFPKTNEVFISDGYGNRRVLVLDAETMAFNRKALKQVGSFGKMGEKPGEVRGLHTIVVDSKWNLWTAETHATSTGAA